MRFSDYIRHAELPKEPATCLAIRLKSAWHYCRRKTWYDLVLLYMAAMPCHSMSVTLIGYRKLIIPIWALI